ncbi:MAG: DUF4384 domain-containing protein [Planctomycetes bacterium]|nr:DUF4384 domain-containing protein [Planctomycetota bacterium]
METRIWWFSALLSALLFAVGCCTSTQDESGGQPGKGEGAGKKPAWRPETTLDLIASDLALALVDKQVSCIAISEAFGPGGEGKDRSKFGTYITEPIAAGLRKRFDERPRERRVRIVALLNKVHRSPEWLQEMSLHQADAFLTGTYMPGKREFELTIQVRLRSGEVIASSHRKLPASEDYLREAATALPAWPTHEPPKATVDATDLKRRLYHAPATDSSIRVAVRPADEPVRVGGKISFLVTSSANGYLSLLYQNSKEHVAFLLPNRACGSPTLRANEVTRIPTPKMEEAFEFEADEPAGWERVKAIVSANPIPWPKDAAGDVPTETIGQLNALLALMAEAKFGEAHCEFQTQR